MSTFITETDTTPSANTNESFSNRNETRSAPAGCVVLSVTTFIPWDNKYDLMSLEVEETFDLIVICVLYVVGVISLVANILNMMVFYKQGLKERINVCLFFQSLADFGYMTINLILYCDRPYLELMHLSRRGPVFKFIVNYKISIFYAFQWASWFMTMVIACERCFCVVSPLRSQRILKTRTMLMIILPAWAFMFASLGFSTTRSEIQCVYNPVTGVAVQEMYSGKFYRENREFIDILDGMVFGLVLPITYLSTVITATIITVKKLRHFASWRQEQATVTSASGVALTVRDINLTRALVGCSVLFVVTNIPNCLFAISILIVPELNLGKKYHNTFNFLGSFTELCNYINCTCNFFIYYSMGTKFRETLHVICRRKKDREESCLASVTKISMSTVLVER